MSKLDLSPDRYAREEARARTLFAASLGRFGPRGGLATYDEVDDRATLSFPVGFTHVFAGDRDERGSAYPAGKVLACAREVFGQDVHVDLISALFGGEGARQTGPDDEEVALGRRDQGLKVSDFGTGSYSLCLHLGRVSQTPPAAREALAEAFFGNAAGVAAAVERDQELVYQRGNEERAVDAGAGDNAPAMP